MERSQSNPVKRVLHVIDSLHLGGAQEVVLNLATCGSPRFRHEVATMHGHGIYWHRLREAGIKAINDGKHGYTPSAGILELREAVLVVVGDVRVVDALVGIAQQRTDVVVAEQEPLPDRRVVHGLVSPHLVEVGPRALDVALGERVEEDRLDVRHTETVGAPTQWIGTPFRLPAFG